MLLMFSGNKMAELFHKLWRLLGCFGWKPDSLRFQKTFLLWHPPSL